MPNVIRKLKNLFGFTRKNPIGKNHNNNSSLNYIEYNPKTPYYHIFKRLHTKPANFNNKMSPETITSNDKTLQWIQTDSIPTLFRWQLMKPQAELSDYLNGQNTDHGVQLEQNIREKIRTSIENIRPGDVYGYIQLTPSDNYIIVGSRTEQVPEIAPLVRNMPFSTDGPRFLNLLRGSGRRKATRRCRN